ncbi:MAG TPA: FtsQ-type POTRA domain-containing protein [Acidimicrobiia bacterium]|nr:FtsQ-type POTRA domain-containing protein [Acidimicrobiia bacterium]
MVDIDPRLAARRQQVAESHARTHFSRIIWILGIALVVGGAVWLARSPYLALTEIKVTGMEAEEVAPVLEAAGLREGRPIVLVRTGEVETALLEDPRIESAEVVLRWPQTAEVYLVRRPPVAWAPRGASWARIAEDGTVIDLAPAPDQTLPLIQLEVDSRPSPELIGALAFVAELSVQSGVPIEVRVQTGELWAQVAGVEVRLGRPVDMEAKARALLALFSSGLSEETTVNLIAPTRPALTYQGDDTQNEEP